MSNKKKRFSKWYLGKVYFPKLMEREVGCVGGCQLNMAIYHSLISSSTLPLGLTVGGTSIWSRQHSVVTPAAVEGVIREKAEAKPHPLTASDCPVENLFHLQMHKPISYVTTTLFDLHSCVLQLAAF